jgi:hypothetical protein
MGVHSSAQLVQADDVDRRLRSILVRGVSHRDDPLVAASCEVDDRNVPLWCAVREDPPTLSTCLGFLHRMHPPATPPGRLTILAPKPWKGPTLIVEPDGIGVLVRVEDGVSPGRVSEDPSLLLGRLREASPNLVVTELTQDRSSRSARAVSIG